MRFSLRTILFVITLVALSLGIGLYLTKNYRERMAIRNELLSLGASDASVTKERDIYLTFVKPTNSLKSFARYGNIKAIELRDNAAKDSLLSLQEPDSLPHLIIRSGQSLATQDLKELSKVNGLTTLVFWGTLSMIPQWI